MKFLLYVVFNVDGSVNMVFDNLDVSRGEPLYSSIQKFYIRNGQSEEKIKHLRVIVDFINNQSIVSKQVLSIQVNDDEDPFYYYSLVLTEEDYQRLKQLQGLLVDFDSFPTQVIRLLEQCKEQESNDSKFLLLLEEDRKNGGDFHQTSLKIVETNNFKHLCHLVLYIEAGNDNDIKKLMLKKIEALKEKNMKAERCISDLESQLFAKSKCLQSKEHELQETKQKWKEERLAFKAESTKELTEETEKLRKVQLEWQIKSQRERNELEDKYQTNLKEKEAELSRLRIENQILQEKRTLADSTIVEQARRIETLEKEVSAFRGDIVSLRKQNAKLDSDYHDKDRQVHSLKTKLAVAEQESKDISVILNKQKELLNSANEQKSRLEEVINEKEKSILRKQTTIQNLSDELVKANEIITKIQKELSLINQKLKVRTVIALEQEKVVETSQKKIAKLEESIISQEKKIQSLLETEKSLKSSLRDFNSTINMKDKKIKENERIIDWLNRRLSEQSKLVCSPSCTTLQNGLISGPTSTPFPQFRNGEVNMCNTIPFSVKTSSVENTNQDYQKKIDDVENTPPYSKISPQTDTREPVSTENLKNDTPKSSEPNKKKTSDSTKHLAKKNSRSVGFKRSTLPEPQITTVPSSYFLK